MNDRLVSVRVSNYNGAKFGVRNIFHYSPFIEPETSSGICPMIAVIAFTIIIDENRLIGI